jgi:ankyrin repeat protein
VNRRKRKKLPELLCAAAGAGLTGQVARLLRAGADPDARNRDGSTPLYLASVQDEPGAVRLLLEAGADPNLESEGLTDGLPLCAAAVHAHLDVARLLLRHGADPQLREDHGTGGSALRCSRGWTELVEEHARVESLLREYAAAGRP